MKLVDRRRLFALVDLSALPQVKMSEWAKTHSETGSRSICGCFSGFGQLLYHYSGSHVLVNFGLVDFIFDVLPSLPAAQPILPNSHQPRQIWTESNPFEIQINSTKSTSRWDTL